MSTELTFDLHTIILLIGPSNSGKTYFCKNVLLPQLRSIDKDLNVQYISSDNIREELIGKKLNKYDSYMKDVSESAFNIIYTKVEAVLRFPIMAEFIVIDSTALSEIFRNRIHELAEKHHYNVSAIMFNYRAYASYLEGITDYRAKRIVTDQIKRYKERVLREIKYASYNKIYKISERVSADTYRVIVPGVKEYLNTRGNPDMKYFIIGDLHECVDELKVLLEKNRFRVRSDNIIECPPNYKIVLIGDYLDKGSKTREIIEFLYQNRNSCILIRGNHEEFTYRHLDTTDEIIKPHYTAIHILRKDHILKQKFKELYHASIPFLWCRGNQRSSFIITHGPCKMKYLGKMDAKSLKNQLIGDQFLNSMDRMSSDILPKLKEVLDKGDTNSVYHIFGHFAFDRLYQLGYNLGIDTGCIGGNKLSGVFIGDREYILRQVSFSNTQEKNDEHIITISQHEINSERVNMEALEDRDIARLNYILQNQINFISGTMCPADKSDVELESLSQGLKYYRDKKIQSIVLQPKYMGSRCTIYLNRNIEKCFATSRNGYRITIDLSKIYLTLLDELSSWIDSNQIKTVILDGELLPWAALGKGLIQSHFSVIANGLSVETKLLKESGFEEELEKIFANPEFEVFSKRFHTTKQATLKEEYGDNNFMTWSHLVAIKPYLDPISTQEANLRIYEKQLQLYGAPTDLCYKPFNILKIIYNDGKEVIPELEGKKVGDLFEIVNKDPICRLQLDDPSADDKSMVYYQQIISQGMEGIVIKPESLTPQERKHVAPYLKVRNPDYLTLIYGPDYRQCTKYNKLLQNKNIKKKLETSIIENNLGLQMLSYCMPIKEAEEAEYKQIVANIIFENKKEEDIDPRL